MKNLRKTGLILFLVVLVSGSTMAMGVVRVDIIPGKKEKALVDILDAQNKKFEVELKDSNGDIVYTYHKKSPSFDYKRIYDFSKLKNGKYTFEVNVGDETELNNLVVNNGHVQILSEKEEVNPEFSLDGKFLEFSFPNSERKSVRLLLYNEDADKLIFQERLNAEFNLQQALNLSHLAWGNYRAVLISGDNSYGFDFYLD